MNVRSKSRTTPPIAGILLVWFLIAALAGAAGLIEAYPLPIPTLVLGLTVGLLLTVWRVPAIRERALEIGPAALVGLNVTRFVGAAFLVLSARGALPPEWAIPTGWGDIAVAVAAVLLLVFAAPFRSNGQRRALLAWNVFGLADMLMVMAGAVRFAFIDPSAASVMERLPMSLLPTFLVPLILTSHVLIFVWLRRTSARGRSAADRADGAGRTTGAKAAAGTRDFHPVGH